MLCRCEVLLEPNRRWRRGITDEDTAITILARCAPEVPTPHCSRTMSHNLSQRRATMPGNNEHLHIPLQLVPEL